MKVREVKQMEKKVSSQRRIQKTLNDQMKGHACPGAFKNKTKIHGISDTLIDQQVDHHLAFMRRNIKDNISLK